MVLSHYLAHWEQIQVEGVAGVAQELSLEGLMNVHSDLWSPILT